MIVFVVCDIVWYIGNTVSQASWVVFGSMDWSKYVCKSHMDADVLAPVYSKYDTHYVVHRFSSSLG